MAGHGDGAPPSHSEDQQMFPASVWFLATFFPLNLQLGLARLPRGPEEGWSGGGESSNLLLSALHSSPNCEMALDKSQAGSCL